MTLQGDLATLELTDIVQNLEMHRRSGTLTVETGRGESRIYFDQGMVTLLASSGRPGLVDDLVRADLVGEAQLEAARKARWRTRRSLCEVLVKRRAIDAGTLQSFAEARLAEDLCEFLVLDVGAFTFAAGDIPRDTFDPEERHLGLGLPVGPLLFEAARRKDHGPAIRSSMPSDAAHYHVAESFEYRGEADAELAARLVSRLDGTRSVSEVLSAFPHQRFAARELLAQLIADGFARTLGADEMVDLVRQLADGNLQRAWRAVQDALAGNGRHVGLLREKARLALALGQPKPAAEAFKLLAHVELEVGDRERALELLLQAGEHDPADTAIWEKALELSAAGDHVPEAITHGLHLVELYRKPGLHARACAVLETLADLEPERWEIQRELGRSRADCGNPTAAVTGLERYGKKLLAREEYKAARAVQKEILTLVPGRRQALETIELIDSHAFARRRARRERLLRRASWGLAAALFAALLVFDSLARIDYGRADREVSERSLIEERRYDEAASLYRAVAERYPATWTAYFDVRRRLADLRVKADAP